MCYTRFVVAFPSVIGEINNAPCLYLVKIRCIRYARYVGRVQSVSANAFAINYVCRYFGAQAL